MGGGAPSQCGRRLLPRSPDERLGLAAPQMLLLRLLGVKSRTLSVPQTWPHSSLVMGARARYPTVRASVACSARRALFLSSHLGCGDGPWRVTGSVRPAQCPARGWHSDTGCTPMGLSLRLQPSRPAASALPHLASMLPCSGSSTVSPREGRVFL